MKLGDWIGVHPLLVLVQVGWLAIFYVFCTGHLAPGRIEPAIIAVIVARNMAMFAFYYTALFTLFHRTRWFSRFKIDPKPPRVGPEVRRSVIGWLVSAGYEVAIYCGVASGTIVLQAETSVLTAVLLLAWADLHFFATHRLLHVKWLYKNIHYVHHLSTNTNVWSTYSMHPVEQLVYFSAMAIVFVVPVSVFHIALLKIAVDYTGAYGHLGFASRFGGSRFHWLHHKRHDVNYGASVIWDRVFGSYRDEATSRS